MRPSHITGLLVLPLLTIAAPSSNFTRTAHAKRAQLDDCLRAAGVPTAAANSAQAFNNRLPIRPAAVAVPTRLEHIQAAVVCGSDAGVKVSAKSGGHSYASLGLGGEDGHLVLDLERMNGVTLDRQTNIATIQAGARLGHVATLLFNQGRRAISHGTCPGVGIAGHALHGGFGMSSHTHGLALDWIVGATVVLADGNVADCSETENTELLWAIKGAGSNFGIVESFKFKTFQAPDQLTPFTVSLGWNNENSMKNGLNALRNFAMNTMPAELNMRLSGSATAVNLEGVYYGNSGGLQNALAPFLRTGGGSITGQRTTGWLDSLRAWANGEKLDETYPYNAHETFYSKSLELKDLQGESLDNFARYWANNARSASGGRNWWFQMDVHGGRNSAVSRVSNDETAYAHRDKLFLIQFYDRVFNGGYPNNGFDFLNNWVDTIIDPLDDPDWGMYINYADSELDRSDAQKLYWGENLQRLQDFKAAADPGELFYYPLSIEPISTQDAAPANGSDSPIQFRRVPTL